MRDRLQAIFDARVVALVARAHPLLGGEILLRLGERGLLVGELLLEDLALALARRGALRGALSRKLAWSPAARCRSSSALRWRGGRDVHLTGDDLALHLFAFAPVIGVSPVAVGATALEDFSRGRLLARRRLLRRQRLLCARGQRDRGREHDERGPEHKLSLSKQ